MSRPDYLTLEELRAVCARLEPYSRDLNFWTTEEREALARGRDKLLERLDHRQAHARSGTAPDAARTR